VQFGTHGDTSASSSYQRNFGYGRGWGQSNEMQQAITALGSVAPTGLAIPVLFGVVPSNLSPNFGDARDSGSRTHMGEDIMAQKGTPVLSPTAAVVVRTVTGADEGNAVYAINPGGYTLVYMHLDKFGEGVSSGTVLQPGSLIGYVGNTGNASGGAPHLHFEVHNASNTAIDPMPFLTQEFTPQQKITFLNTIFSSSSDPVALSQLLAANFRTTFINDQNIGIILPPLINGALGSAVNVSVPIATPVAVASTGSTVSTGALVLTRNLYKGISGEDVRKLQQFLNSHGFAVAAPGLVDSTGSPQAGSPGNETIYFGPATEAAVIRFQLAHAIQPSVGYVGPITRASIAVA